MIEGISYHMKEGYYKVKVNNRLSVSLISNMRTKSFKLQKERMKLGISKGFSNREVRLHHHKVLRTGWETHAKNGLNTAHHACLTPKGPFQFCKSMIL